MTLGADGYDGESRSITVPVLITRNWMVSRNDVFAVCGATLIRTGSGADATTTETPNFLALIRNTHAAGKHADPRCTGAVTPAAFRQDLGTKPRL